MTEEDVKREKMAAEERKKEFQSVSDRYLWELMGITEKRLAEIRAEYQRRNPVPQQNKWNPKLWLRAWRAKRKGFAQLRRVNFGDKPYERKDPNK